MSHFDQSPLSQYNSLCDGHLAGYFSNTKMRRHLRKSGLVSRRGQIVSENTYRLNMARKEHKKHVKDLLAQAIVHKTLDLERNRQSEIRRKLEEIAKIELVRRVRNETTKDYDEDILPYLSPRSYRSPSPPKSERKRNKILIEETEARYNGDRDLLPYLSPRSRSQGPRSVQDDSSNHEQQYRAESVPPPCDRSESQMSCESSHNDDTGVIYVDDDGNPVTFQGWGQTSGRQSRPSRQDLESRHMYALDPKALRQYAMNLARYEQGFGHSSPYLMPQVPLPPRSPRMGHSARSRPVRSRSDSAEKSPRRPVSANALIRLHRNEPPMTHMTASPSHCEVKFKYHGWALHLAREQMDPRQEVYIEQQHCGGNTLIAFKNKLLPGDSFSIISKRHRNYPFSLTIFVDGRQDSRVSTCCEYRHRKGVRLGGKQGHFSIVSVKGAAPCYKCQVERGGRKREPKQEDRQAMEIREEVTIVKEDFPGKKPDTKQKEEEEDTEILVPVETDGDETLQDKGDKSDTKEKLPEQDDYADDDFEDSDSDASSSSSSSSSSSKKKGICNTNVHTTEVEVTETEHLKDADKSRESAVDKQHAENLTKEEKCSRTSSARQSTTDIKTEIEETVITNKLSDDYNDNSFEDTITFKKSDSSSSISTKLKSKSKSSLSSKSKSKNSLSNKSKSKDSASNKSMSKRSRKTKSKNSDSNGSKSSSHKKCKLDKHGGPIEDKVKVKQPSTSDASEVGEDIARKSVTKHQDRPNVDTADEVSDIETEVESPREPITKASSSSKDLYNPTSSVNSAIPRGLASSLDPSAEIVSVRKVDVEDTSNNKNKSRVLCETNSVGYMIEIEHIDSSDRGKETTNLKFDADRGFVADDEKFDKKTIHSRGNRSDDDKESGNVNSSHRFEKVDKKEVADVGKKIVVDVDKVVVADVDKDVMGEEDDGEDSERSKIRPDFERGRISSESEGAGSIVNDYKCALVEYDGRADCSDDSSSSSTDTASCKRKSNEDKAPSNKKKDRKYKKKTSRSSSTSDSSESDSVSSNSNSANCNKDTLRGKSLSKNLQSGMNDHVKGEDQIETYKNNKSLINQEIDLLPQIVIRGDSKEETDLQQTGEIIPNEFENSSEKFAVSDMYVPPDYTLKFHEYIPSVSSVKFNNGEGNSRSDVIMIDNVPRKTSIGSESLLSVPSSEDKKTILSSMPSSDASNEDKNAILSSKPSSNASNEDKNAILSSKPSSNASSEDKNAILSSMPSSNASSRDKKTILSSKPSSNASGTDKNAILSYTPSSNGSNKSFSGDYSRKENDFNRRRISSDSEPSLQDKPDVLDDKPDVDKPDVLDDKPDVLDGKPDVLDGKPDVLDDKPDVLDGKPDVLDYKPDVLDDKPDVDKSDVLNAKLDVEDDEKLNKQMEVLDDKIDPEEFKSGFGDDDSTVGRDQRERDTKQSLLDNVEQYDDSFDSTDTSESYSSSHALDYNKSSNGIPAVANINNNSEMKSNYTGPVIPTICTTHVD